MSKHSPLIWLAAFTVFFAILAWPLAVHAQGSAGGYGSSGGTFVSTYSAGSSGGTHIARRTPTQVLPRARSFQPLQRIRSLLKRPTQTVNVAQTPIAEAAEEGLMRCERCGKVCRCPYCNRFVGSSGVLGAAPTQCSCTCFCPKCGNKLTCQCDCTADKNSVTCPACGYVSDCPCDCKSTAVTAKKEE